MVRKFLSYQKFSGKMKRSAIPLQPILVKQPFAQWELDVIGPINPESSKGHVYIITTTNCIHYHHHRLFYKVTGRNGIKKG
jgi:hypothetical protein